MFRREIAPTSVGLADVWGKNRKAHPLNALRAVGDGPWRVLHLLQAPVAQVERATLLRRVSRWFESTQGRTFKEAGQVVLADRLALVTTSQGCGPWMAVSPTGS